MYTYYNPNPDGKRTGDCVIRAIARVTGGTWEEIYAALAVQGMRDHEMPSTNAVWGNYLKAQGFKRRLLPDTCPDCYTVEKFARDNYQGAYIAATGSHVVAVVDGDYYDAWDSGNEVVTYYWTKEGA